MKCPFCLREGNIQICDDMFRCFNHDVHVWFNFTKRIIGYDGFCVELCFEKVSTEVFKCPKSSLMSVFVVDNFDYNSPNRILIWESLHRIECVRPRTFKKFLNRIRTIVVFS